MNNNLLSKERKSQLIKFCKSVKISFNNLDLLNQAFCHRSITNEVKYFKNNERLEFLGDAVLEIVSSEFLYDEEELQYGYIEVLEREN